jgi:hypothetical protein
MKLYKSEHNITMMDGNQSIVNSSKLLSLGPLNSFFSKIQTMSEQLQTFI